MVFISRLKQPQSCFFLPFLFPSYCHSIVYRVVGIVSDGCNQSSFNVFLYSLRAVVSMRQRRLRCWQVLFFPLFSILIACQRCLWDVMPYAWSLVFLFHLFKFISSPLEKGSRISNEGHSPSIIIIILFYFYKLFIIFSKYFRIMNVNYF